MAHFTCPGFRAGFFFVRWTNQATSWSGMAASALRLKQLRIPGFALLPFEVQYDMIQEVAHATVFRE